jgi:hypothetical protein
MIFVLLLHASAKRVVALCSSIVRRKACGEGNEQAAAGRRVRAPLSTIQLHTPAVAVGGRAHLLRALRHRVCLV